MRFDEILMRHGPSTGGLGARLAAASAATRATAETQATRVQDLAGVAAGVAGPALVSYVLWILSRAREEGIQRLYFVARDGLILSRIATELIGRLHLDLDARYIYGSRQAWHLPAMQQMGEQELEWILEEAGYLSWTSLLARVDCTPEELAPQLRAAGFTDWNMHLASSQRKAAESVLRGEYARDLVLAKARQRRGVVVDYLRQEGMLSGVRCATVDVGWKGRLHHSLNTLLASAGQPPVRGYFFGLEPSTHVHSDSGLREGWLFDAPRGTGILDMGYHVAQMVEMWCSADHGSTFGYAAKGGMITPVLREPTQRGLVEWGLLDVHRLIMEFVRRLELSPSDIETPADIRQTVAELLLAFWFTPTPAEALAWGSFPVEADQAGEFALPLAQPYQLRDVLGSWMSDEWPTRHPLSWPAGSVMMSTRAVRSAFRIRSRLRRARGK